eukprot:s1152_g2.t1
MFQALNTSLSAPWVEPRGVCFRFISICAPVSIRRRITSSFSQAALAKKIASLAQTGQRTLDVQGLRTASAQHGGALANGEVHLFALTLGLGDHCTKAGRIGAIPAWQRATEPRADPDPTEEDLLPSNQRHPRVAPAWLKHEKQVLRFYAFFQDRALQG